jgi:putative transposase
MRSLLTQQSMPEEHRDTHKWPQIDVSQFPLEERASIERRQRAIRAYVEGQPLAVVCRECHQTPSNVIRLFRRALVVQSDGRIFGWRTVLPYSRQKDYRRLAKPNTGSLGQAGSFKQFFVDHPRIAQTLTTAVLTLKIPENVAESRSSGKSLYSLLRRLCREEGISETQYPFNTKDQGRRSLRRWSRELLKSRFVKGARLMGGADAASRARVNAGHAKHFVAKTPYDITSIDEHQLNSLGAVEVPTTSGGSILVLAERVHLLCHVEHYSTAILGHHVAIASQPSASDVVQTIINSLGVWKPRQLTLPGHQYPPNAAMPSVIKEAVGHLWNTLFLDNATIHNAHTVADNIHENIGCAMNWGPVKHWDRRPLIEAIFSSIERSAFLRLPNTTGTGPEDALRPNGGANALKYRITLAFLLDLLDIVICTYNATRREDLGNRSPLEVRLSYCKLVLATS